MTSAIATVTLSRPPDSNAAATSVVAACGRIGVIGQDLRDHDVGEFAGQTIRADQDPVTDGHREGEEVGFLFHPGARAHG